MPKQKGEQAFCRFPFPLSFFDAFPDGRARSATRIAEPANTNFLRSESLPVFGRLNKTANHNVFYLGWVERQ
ncbi:MAG TPA: hypothetical protein VGJ55_15890, partial [Pyrinomonadaceae bacterium]